MKLVSFRIKHFKSIDDSNECSLASDVTVLAGKNEAGKTNLLQALQKFNYGEENNFEKTDYPLDKEGVEPEVTLKFELTEKDLEEFKNKLSLQDIPKPTQIAKIPIVITKKANNDYVFDSPSGSFTDLIRNEEDNTTPFEDELTTLVDELRGVLSSKNLNVQFITENNPLSITSVAELSTQLGQAIAALAPGEQDPIKELVEKIKIKVTEIDTATKEITNKKELFLKGLPKLVLFDSFDQEELLPYEVPLTDAEKNKAVCNYCSIVGIAIKDIVETTDTQLRRKLVNEKSAIVDGDFGEYWKQDKINLTMSSYGENLIFGIKEEGKNYDFKVEQRSKGLQWFLSFYLLLKAESKNKQNIILVDEPGLYVHAKAQWDILRVLTDLSSQNKFIFSTHSPYLIDPSRLDRIRLAIKNLERKVNGKLTTELGSKVFELSGVHTADKDTLTPIITAIGLDISKQLSFAAEHNIVLEGISDYNFLRGVIETLSKKQRSKLDKLHLIPCKGADNIPTVISLLLGWGLSFKALLDNDDKGKEINKIFEERFLLDNKNILFVSNTDNHCIEDVFSKEDFNVLVLAKSKEYEKTRLNSEVIPDSQKAILSRNFLNTVREKKVKLSKETKDNFVKILDELEKI
ncbi:MAG: AAA family ATPase [Patescibacteria group bacterium]